MAVRKASATWEGKIREGNGRFRGESGIIDAPFSFGSRFTDEGGTNPEELLAAAEAACFSMALTGNLERAGIPSTRVHTDAECTVERVGDGFQITSIRLRTRAQVPGADAETFARVAQQTKETCPVSKALAAVPIELDAALE